jgi:glycosyltransferase involved in cell wall biosynthesis
MRSSSEAVAVPIALVPSGARVAVPVDAARTAEPPVVCHVTVAHRELKSRTFYMQLAPLAEIGIPVRYVSPAITAKPKPGVTFVPIGGGLGRFAQLLRAPAIVRTLLQQNASVYHFQDPELLPAAFALKLLFGKKIVFDCYEDFASMALQSQRIPGALKPLAGSIVLHIQRVAARVFDGVITADPLTLCRFARTGRSKKLVFYNLPNLDVFPDPVAGLRPFDVVYRGGVSERAGTWILLEALRLLKLRGVAVKALLIGYFDDFEAKAQLFRRVDALGLSENVFLEGRIEHTGMWGALRQAKIGISPLLDTPKFQRNIPVKVFEYWACGLPAIASDLAPIRPFFKSANAGLLFRSGDALALADSIQHLLRQPELAAEMGRRGREAVERRFNNRSEVRKLHRLLTRIAASQ